MNKPCHILVLLFFSFSSALSITLVVHTARLMSPLSAIFIIFLALGFTALFRPLIVMRPPIPLRHVRSWELNGELYRVLGVRGFGRLLRRSLLRYFNSAVYLSRWHGDIAAVASHMEAAEAAHLWAMTLTIPYILYAAFQKRWMTVLSSIVFNLGLNVYPILHLRLARGRLFALSARRSMFRSPLSAKKNL